MIPILINKYTRILYMFYYLLLLVISYGTRILYFIILNIITYHYYVELFLWETCEIGGKCTWEELESL
jgi:hypothetical protein